jgi:hypothetical protein
MRVRATHHGVLKISYDGVSRSSKQTGDPERVQSRHETDDFDTQPIAGSGYLLIRYHNPLHTACVSPFHLL